MITGDLPASFRAHSATVGSSSRGHDDVVDDAGLTRLFRVPALTEQQQLVGVLARHVSVDQRHDHERERADVDLRRAERGLLGGDDQIARQRNPERAGQHVPAGRADRRLAELADQLEQRDEALAAEVPVNERRLSREAAQVRARGEGLLVRGGEHDAACVVIVARALEGLDQPGEHLGDSALRVLRLVERDRRHARLV